jgi:hypothetical protein
LFNPRRTRLSRDTGRLTTTNWNPFKDPDPRPRLPRALRWLRTSYLAKCLNSAPGRPASTLSTTRAGALMARSATCESYQSHSPPCHRRVAVSHRIAARKERVSFPDSTSYYSFHDYSRIGARGSPPTSTVPSLASSTSSSLRSSPAPSGLYQATFVPHVPAPPRIPRVPREFSVLGCYRALLLRSALFSTEHGFTPRTIGGTTYFPIRLGSARLGYVTLSGVEVFTNH